MVSPLYLALEHYKHYYHAEYFTDNDRKRLFVLMAKNNVHTELQKQLQEIDQTLSSPNARKLFKKAFIKQTFGVLTSPRKSQY